jgi:tetratricopeptide (TPR) repeat protein
MKTVLKLLITSTLCFFTSSLTSQDNDTHNSVAGKWVRMSQTGPVALDFKNDGKVEVDFNADQIIDVVTEYEIGNNTISFIDKEGAMCPEHGVYEFKKTDYYLAFDLMDDMCNGRVKMTMGFWTKPNFQEFLTELSQNISTTKNPELNLTRARIFLAIGKSVEAKADLDVYINYNPNDARAYINRAGTRFPTDMEGVVSDCNKAIALEPNNKNVYFLRGLAVYEMGEKERACEDFSRAIELGFSILRIAEQQRCSEFWD